MTNNKKMEYTFNECQKGTFMANLQRQWTQFIILRFSIRTIK